MAVPASIMVGLTVGFAEGAVAWLLVIIAGILETGFAVCLKLSDGFSKIWPTVGFASFALGSFGLLTLSLKTLEVGPAYAVWTGIGAAGTAIVGMIWLGESVSVLKLVSISLVLIGVIGLQLSGAGH
ncbi:quaternary ammonium compound-resistance protein SugE [Streptacidiphilus jiangxiensis]|uniref:Quaternary ammonium compound-resistance protein SugE n=1 Tax=Streptacidiphilus jiangxiensis TaxID=235985 RepID=A0A1H7G4T7_STRJI|nr:quaternary ammonium compound-resistance protein SugE [Streptacidiphilus jiangxiensis]